MIEQVDITEANATIHIRVDSSQMQKNQQLRFLMLEQTVASMYEDAQVVKVTNEYGLLTDIWIHFKDPNDATHFRLSFQ